MPIRTLPLLALLIAATACRRPGTVPAAPAVPAGTRATLAILETTDLHSHVRSFDYYKLAEDDSVGLERTATLIRQARAAFPNTLLFDDGDTIQGTALADVQALVKPPAAGEELAVFKAMDALGYDAATLGNHEFNFGLGFLGQVLGRRFDVDGVPAHPLGRGPAFPVVSANVLSAKTGQPLVEPFTLLNRSLQATTPDGRTVQVPFRVGVLGLTTPLITTWDKANLQGKVVTKGVVETAALRVPELKAKGAEFLVVLSHGGVDGASDRPDLENANLHLAKVPGIDAILMGHTHQSFPDAGRTAPAGVDATRGTLHGVPAVMSASGGRALGVLTFQLVFDGSHWQVDRAKTHAEVRPVRAQGQPAVPPDPTIAPLVEAEHRAALSYVKTPVGHTDFRLCSAFADLGEPSAVQPINMAQTDYLKAYVAANAPQLKGLPVLSMTEAFKSGPRSITNIPAGDLAIAQAADLYPYLNTLQAVKVDGSGLKAWLEHAARRFHRIDPAAPEPQELVDRANGGSLDMPTDPDLTFEIDVTRAEGDRIRALAYRGRPVDAALSFLVATNNYRASGGQGFPGLDGSRTVVESPDANRDVLIAWLRRERNLTLARHGATRSWRFTPVKTAGPVVLHSAPGLLPFAQERGLPVSLLKADDGRGFSLYAVDLSQPVKAGTRD